MHKTKFHSGLHDFFASEGAKYFGEPCQIHHCVGRTAKHKKEWIGEEFVIPLPPRLHQGEGSRRGSVHGDPIGFAKSFGFDRRIDAERYLFLKFAAKYPYYQENWERAEFIASYSK